MRNPGANYVAILQLDTMDMVDLVEFYAPSQTSLVPANASKLFAQSNITWGGNNYTQQMLSRGNAFTWIDGKFNTCAVNLSNNDRLVGAWLALTNIKGYRMVIRRVSRQEDTQSDVIFVGRCEQVSDIDNSQITITAKQDLGNLYVNLPFRVFSPTCQVKGGFKGTECLAGESLGSKSAPYQAATTCDYSYGTCTAYSNTNAFQGQRFIALKGHFKLQQKSGGATGGQWSSQDGNAKGKAVPLGFGRTQLKAVPLMYADTGQYLAGQWGFGEGPLTKILNFRNVSEGWATSFQAVTTHLGKYGPDAEQVPAGFFSTGGMRHSHLAYGEVTIKGQNADTGDTAPDLVAVLLWQAVPIYSGGNWSTSAWSDNPVACLRWLLTDTRLLGYSTAWIDDTSFGALHDYCDTPMLDQTGGEDLFLSNEMSANGGVDLIRYRSTGIIDTYYYRTKLGIDSTLSQEVQATYNYFNPVLPGTISAGTYYRRRYTCNWHLLEQQPIADFIFKHLLPSFNGYLIQNYDGKIKLGIEKPALAQYLRASVSAGATQLAIENVADWMALTYPVIYGILDTWTANCEPFTVSSSQYSTVGNTVTLVCSATGTITATASGALLSGATSSTPATGSITIGGTITAGNVITVTIDGNAVQYTVKSNDTTGTIGGMIATIINSNASLKRYITATWSTSTPTVVNLTCNLGLLNLSSPLTYAHSAAVELMNVTMVFTDVAAGPNVTGNIIRDSFKWPLANREDEYNQFEIVYNDAKADFSETTILENDVTRQATTNQPIKYAVSGQCVDNYHQANRLVIGARYKHGEDRFFVQLAAVGLATLLEVGDVIAVNHSSMPGRTFIPARIEDVQHLPDKTVQITARRYVSTMYPESSVNTTISLETSVTWPTNGPGAPTTPTLTAPNANTIRGTFAFATYEGGQYGRVQVLKSGAGSFVETGILVRPDASNNGTFEISGLPPGSTQIKIQPMNTAGVDGTASSAATITVTGTSAVYSFSSADPWTINHNLGYYPQVACYDNSGNALGGTITNPTVNQTVVTFGVAKSGTARVY